MSITNYFGKPRTKYVPYKSPYTFDNLPNIKCDRIGGNLSHYADGSKKYFIVRYTGKDSVIENKNDNERDEILYNLSKFISQNSKPNFISPSHITDGVSIFGTNYESEPDRFVLHNINVMFDKFIHEIIEWIEQPIWKLVKSLPVINMMQVLILKLSDVDKHVGHLEKMVASLCEDNLSLNNRIKALEQRYDYHSHIPIAEAILKL